MYGWSVISVKHARMFVTSPTVFLATLDKNSPTSAAEQFMFVGHGTSVEEKLQEVWDATRSEESEILEKLCDRYDKSLNISLV